ncbi:MAG: hypothetical protein HY678_10200 [Chloroflexi bacterium]|nr:hypothetical protein [Chloroflexota bacterium]
MSWAAKNDLVNPSRVAFLLMLLWSLAAAACSSRSSANPDAAIKLRYLTLLVLAIATTLSCGGGPAPSPTEQAVPTAAVVTPTEAPPQVDDYPFEVVRGDFLVLPAPGGGAVKRRRFATLLGSIPDAPDARLQVWLNDFGYMWRFFEERGIARPGENDPPDAVVQALRTVLGQGLSLEIGELLPWPDSAPWIAGGLGTDYPNEYLFHAASGFDARNVELAAKTGPGNDRRGLNKGREELAVVLGDYEREAIFSKLRSCDECAPYDAREYAGIDYMAWGEDFEISLRNRLKPPWFDSLGRAGRVAIFEGKIVQAWSNEGIEGLIDVQADRGASLGDDPAVAIAANVLDSLGVFSAVVSAADFSLDGLDEHLARRCVGRDGYTSSDFALYAQCPTRPAGSEGAAGESQGSSVARTAPLLKPFKVAAFGQLPRTNLETRQTVVVLVHGDETSARQNVDLVLRRLAQTRLSDGLPLYVGRLRQVEVQVEGAVLMARITWEPRGGIEYLSPGALIDMPLTVHE